MCLNLNFMLCRIRILTVSSILIRNPIIILILILLSIISVVNITSDTVGDNGGWNRRRRRGVGRNGSCNRSMSGRINTCRGRVSGNSRDNNGDVGNSVDTVTANSLIIMAIASFSLLL